MSSHITTVDIGTPPRSFKEWEQTEVRYHGFVDLPATGIDFSYPYLQSPEFTCFGHRWCLRVYPDGDENDDGMVPLYLHHMSEEAIKVQFSFTVKNYVESGEKKHFLSEEKLFQPHGDLNLEGEDYWGTADFANFDFATREQIINSLVDGTLIIEVGIRQSEPAIIATLPSFIPENPLCKNILKKFMDEESADVLFEVEVEVGGDTDTNVNRRSARKKARTSPATFHAHRLILQDGAPTLAELCKCKSGDLTSVPITDVKPDVFHHMLYYAYGGKVTDDDMKSHAQEIIDASDKYGIVNLKLEAEACYVKSISLTSDNVLDHLLYADSKNCALLKEVVMDFIVENGDDVLEKVSFDDVPGYMMKDLLTAVTRGKKKDDDSSDAGNYDTMRVSTLRKMLHDKELDIDGSREAMIALLKKHS